MLSRVTYISKRCSKSKNLDWNAELQTILSRSRVHNTWQSISGALLANETLFAQVIEGEPKALDLLFARISVDPRHTIIRVEDVSIPVRSFRNWSMAYINMSQLDMTVLGPLTDFWQGSQANGLILMMRHLLENADDLEMAAEGR